MNLVSLKPPLLRGYASLKPPFMAWNNELAPKMNTIGSHQRVFTVWGQKTTNLSCFLMFFEIFSQKLVISTIFKNLVKIQIFC